MAEIVGGIAALVLTVLLLTYLIGDNPFYRVAAHLFIGLTSGYVVVIAFEAVIWPNLINLGNVVSTGDLGLIIRSTLVATVASIGGVLLLLKTVHVGRRLGGLVVAGMLGVGAAVAVGGAITGTLLPQTTATFISLAPTGQGNQYLEYLVEGLFTIIGTLVTLGFFWYGGKAEPGNPVERTPIVRPVAAIGQVFIAITFGAMYAGALAASVAIFTSSLTTSMDFLKGLLNL